MKTRCLSKSAMFLISFECERLAQMPAVTRKIHNPVKLVHRLMNRRWSSASISIVLAVCSRKAWETKKDTTEKESQNRQAISGVRKKEKEKTEGRRRHAERVAEFNRSRPFNHTCSSLKHRRPIDEGEKQNWRILNKPSLTMQRFCMRPCSYRVFPRTLLYLPIDRSIVVSAWREIDSTSLNILFPWPQKKLQNFAFSNNKLQEWWILFFDPCWNVFYEFAI